MTRSGPQTFTFSSCFCLFFFSILVCFRQTIKLYFPNKCTIYQNYRENKTIKSPPKHCGSSVHLSMFLCVSGLRWHQVAWQEKRIMVVLKCFICAHAQKKQPKSHSTFFLNTSSVSLDLQLPRGKWDWMSDSITDMRAETCPASVWGV